MFKDYLLPSLVCGFGAAVFSAIPGFEGIACCLFIPAGSFLALFLYQKSTGTVGSTIKTDTALTIGFMTGILAALFSTAFDVIITAITHTNDFIEALPMTKETMRDFNLGEAVDEALNIMEGIASEIRSTGFSLVYTLYILISKLLVNTIFGVIGGLVGMLIINRRNQ